jgi:hypothetical protein
MKPHEEHMQKHTQDTTIELSIAVSPTPGRAEGKPCSPGLFNDGWRIKQRLTLHLRRNDVLRGIDVVVCCPAHYRLPRIAAIQSKIRTPRCYNRINKSS